MNCPTCGTPNDADARFCAECGTPLENADNEATIVGQRFNFDQMSDDLAADSPVDPVSEARTVSVDQDFLADVLQDTGVDDDPLTDSALAALTPTSETEPEPSPVPSAPVVESPAGVDLPSPAEEEAVISDIPSPADASPPAADTPAEDSKSGNSKKMIYIIGGILLFLILCCCCSSIIAGTILPGILEELTEEIMMDLGSIQSDVFSLI
jgi:hypothetical protein